MNAENIHGLEPGSPEWVGMIRDGTTFKFTSANEFQQWPKSVILQLCDLIDRYRDHCCRREGCSH